MPRRILGMIFGLILSGLWSGISAAEVEMHLGMEHSCLRQGDLVSCAGMNHGQIVVGSFPGLQQVETAFNATCLRIDGKVRCQGSSARRFIDELPADLAGVDAIGLGNFSLCARSGATVNCWGDRATRLPTAAFPAIDFEISGNRVCLLAVDRLSYRCWSTLSGDSRPVAAGRSTVPIDELLVTENEVCSLAQGTLTCRGGVRLERVRQAAAAARFICALTWDDVQCASSQTSGFIRAFPVGKQDRLVAHYGTVCAYSSDPREKVNEVCWTGSGVPPIAPVFKEISKHVLTIHGDCGFVGGKFECWSLRGPGGDFLRYSSRGRVHQFFPVDRDEGGFFLRDDGGVFDFGFDSDRIPVRKEELFATIFFQASEVRGRCARTGDRLNCWMTKEEANREVLALGPIDRFRGKDGYGGGTCFNLRASTRIQCYDNWGDREMDVDHGSFVDYGYARRFPSLGFGRLFILSRDRLIFERPHSSPLVRTGFKNASRLWVLNEATACVLDEAGLQCFDQDLKPIAGTFRLAAQMGRVHESEGTGRESFCMVLPEDEGKLDCLGNRDLGAPARKKWSALSGVTRVIYLEDQTCAVHSLGLTCWGDEAESVGRVVHDYVKF